MITTSSWISKKPDRCGGDACVRDSRIPVWVLVGYRDLGKDDVWLLNAYPSLTPDDLAAAWSMRQIIRMKSSVPSAKMRQAKKDS